MVIEEDLNPCDEIPPFGPCIIPVILESEKFPTYDPTIKKGPCGKSSEKRRKTTSQEKMRQVNVRFVEYVRFV